MITQIQEYKKEMPSFIEWNPIYPETAALIIDYIHHPYPWIELHHLGSSSIPGCGGKGLIDLYAACPDGQLDQVRDAIDTLGFQRQKGIHAFPESRPMRIGAVKYNNRVFYVHLHIVDMDSEEFKATVEFRETMMKEPVLLDEYVALKKKILSDGVNDSLEYCLIKGKFFEKHGIASADED